MVFIFWEEVGVEFFISSSIFIVGVKRSCFVCLVDRIGSLFFCILVDFLSYE